MNKRQAKYRALGACADLIRVHAKLTNLYTDGQSWSDEDRARFTDACDEVATELEHRANAYLRGRRPRRPASLRLGRDY